MIDPSITYFPVGNGDTTLIRLSDKTSILIDCNITQGSKDENEKSKYPVHEHLLEEIEKNRESIPHIDAFILTHPDEDHCRGFGDTFHTGDPSSFSKTDQNEGKILIDELWFTPRIFSPCEESLSEPAKCIYKEAKRRMKLYQNADSKSENPGNRLRIIGYSDNEELKGLDKILTTPGNSINLINSSIKSDFSFFIHAPFKKENDSDSSERNDTSIVLQVRFDVGDVENSGLVFFGGDSTCSVFERIIDISEKEDLEWDLLLAPHHCSWHFFNELSHEEDQTLNKKIISFLEMHREGAFIIASCKPVKDDKDPPSIAAAKEYKKIVGSEKFIVTMENPNEEEPLPLHFVITRMGPQRKNLSVNKSIVSSAAVQAVIKTPQTYGKQYFFYKT